MSTQPLILNVNDDEAARYVLTRGLTKAGFEVVEAATGYDALVIAFARRPDAVVLDVRLPDVDGFEVCRRLRDREETSRTIVVHVSAEATTTDRRVHGLEAGADAYLVQPVDDDELAATLKSLLRMRREEQAANEAFRHWQVVFDAIPDALFVISDHGTVLRANRALCTLIGRTLNGAIGRSYDDVIAPTLGPLDGLLHQGDRAAAGGTREIERRGRVFTVSADDVREGHVRGKVITLTDVTLRRSIEEQRDRLYREAQAANRAKDEFLATLSHELRTPLNAILGWAQMFRDGRVDDSSQHRAIDAILRNAKLQEHLISDVLDVARITSGRLRMSIGPTRMSTVLDAALDAVRPAAAAKGIKLEVELDDEHDHLRADAERLQQVAWNLLSNAIKFTPRGGTVRVANRRVDDDVEIVVTDSGAGISPEFLPFVFDRFRQADASATRTVGGLGLGLAIVRHLVELHGGTVQARSDGLGSGATFVVSIPAEGRNAARESQRPSRRAIRAELARAHAEELAGLRILVVDDDADTRDALESLLGEFGAEVVTASSAATARDVLERGAVPNVIVSDIGMPEEDGCALITSLRKMESGARVPAIALTAYARREDSRRVVDAGFDLHLAKPADAAALVAAIRALAASPPAQPMIV